MNLKSRIAGALATVVLGTSLMGGTALADTNTTSATLSPDPNGVCSAAADTSTIDFGIYEWDVDHYVLDGPAPVLNFTVTSTYGPGTGCDVSITASNLTNGTGGTITNADLQLNSLTGTGAVSPVPYYLAYGYQWVDNGIGDYSGPLQLNGLWRAPGHPLAYAVGTYTGTLTFTSTLGTP
jgi:hypothetical protein